MAGYDEQSAPVRQFIANHHRPIIFGREQFTGRLIMLEVHNSC
jgi:hypothetical protein